jgi:hypothetical protein
MSKTLRDACRDDLGAGQPSSCGARHFEKIVINKRVTRRAPQHPKEAEGDPAAPPSALASSLSATIRCSRTSSEFQTIADLGSNKYFTLASALFALANKI